MMRNKEVLVIWESHIYDSLAYVHLLFNVNELEIYSAGQQKLATYSHYTVYLRR
jgi:hypothetical protein